MGRKPEFVHLHNHTEYSRQDGLQKLDEMCRVAAADGQPAIASTDHGTLAAAYQLVKAARKHGIKPILGEEVYLAIGSRKERLTLAGDADDGSEADEGAYQAADGRKERRYHHLTVLAADRTGWKNLVRLHNDAAEHVWYKPRTDLEALGEHHQGLIVGTGCLGGPVASRFLAGDDEGAYQAADALLEAVGGDKDRLFVEIMSHGIDFEDLIVTPKLIVLAKKMGLRLVASNDAHYTHGCDKAEGVAANHYHHGCEPEAHDLLLALGTNAQRDDPKRYRFNGHGYHLRTAAEMDAIFSRISGAQDAVRNSLVIADMVETNVMGLTPEVQYHLPRFPVPEADVAEYEALKAQGDTRFTSASNYHLVKTLRQKAIERYGEPLPERVKDSLNFENRVIRDAGMDDYMLIVSDLLDWARQSDIVTGPGRGSAVGSVMAYSSGITDVEPTEHNLLFERFLDPTRVGMPDIDSDFDRAGRARVLKQVEEKYGHDRVALIGTRGTYKAKGAVRHVGRLTDRTDTGAALAEQVWSRAGFTATLDQLVDPTVPDSAGFREVLETDPAAPTLLALARTIEGTRADVGIHACGVLVCDESMLDQVPLRRDASSGMWVTEWEGPELDALGYLKLDILGLRTLDVVSTCLDMMRGSGIETPDITYRGIEIDPDTSPRARAAWELIGAGDTEGVFQLASDGMRQLAQQVQPRHLGDLSALVALYRPGPMGAKMHEKYGDRKHGREPVSYDYLTTDPAEQAVIASVLDDTLGLIIYQESVMTLAGAVAGFGPSAKNKLRKAFSKKKKDEMDALEEQFISGATTVTEDGEDSTASIAFRESTARELWRTFSASAEYLFNRCVFFDTEVVNGKNLRWTVEQLYFRLYGNDDASPDLCPFCEERPRARNATGICGRCRSWHTMFNDPARGFHLLAHDSADGRIRPQRVAGVHANGIKDVIRLTTASGRSVRVTDNHRMLTPDGYVEAGRLAVGDELVSHEGYERQVYQPSERTTVGERRRTGKVGHGTPELGYNYIDGGYLALKTWTEATIDTAACDECGLTRDQGRLERAHLDGNRTNNDPSNLAWKCVSHHKAWDYAHNGRRRRWDKGHLAGTDPVVSITPGGRGMTYDVEMAEGTDHNFVANGLVSHNSHSAAYGFVGYITAYLKANWPSHFGAATLATTKDDAKRADILRSLRHQGIEVRPPSVVDGLVSTWVAPDGAVVLGLGEVDGVGDNAHAIVAEREVNGEFTSLSDLVNRVRVTTNRQSQDKTEHRSSSTDVCHRCTGLVVTDETDDEDLSAFEACGCSSAMTRPGEDHEPPVRTWTTDDGTSVEVKIVKAGTKNHRLRRTERRPVLDGDGNPVMDESWLSLGIVESLIKAGACDSFGPRLGQLAVVRALREAPDLPVPDVEVGIIERERVARDKLGVTIGAGPFGHRELGRAVLDWEDPDPVRNGPVVGVHRVLHPGWYQVGGVLDRWQVRHTRRGAKMASFTISDSKGSMDGVMWESGLEMLEESGTVPQVGDVVVISAKAKDRTITRTVQADVDASIDTDTGEEFEQVTETVTVRELSAEQMWVFRGDVGSRDVPTAGPASLPMPRVHRAGERTPTLPDVPLAPPADPEPEPEDDPEPAPARPRVISVRDARLMHNHPDLLALMPGSVVGDRRPVVDRIRHVVKNLPGASLGEHEFDLDLDLPDGPATVTVRWAAPKGYDTDVA